MKKSNGPGSDPGVTLQNDFQPETVRQPSPAIDHEDVATGEAEKILDNQPGTTDNE